MDNEYAPCVLIEYPDGMYGLILSDANFTHYDVFAELKRAGNGHDWASVVDELLRRENPPWVSELEHDPEAGMFVTRSYNRQALREVARLIQSVMADKELLRDVVRNASQDYR